MGATPKKKVRASPVKTPKTPMKKKPARKDPVKKKPSMKKAPTMKKPAKKPPQKSKKRPANKTADSGSSGMRTWAVVNDTMVCLDSDFDEADLTHEERYNRARIMIYRDWVEIRDYNAGYGYGCIDFFSYLSERLVAKGFKEEQPSELRRKFPLGPNETLVK